ncbi:ferredoxin--NADP reductase [Maribellus maritimus]|uniref:ferredoxin--NADP reductase n=1 Tax=Maribellus maritimus TaxID=2870838 RepID=UPI001EECBE30|nr:oxidoreductase [Maribellus maritimus]MCG6189594.1 oxidoreductase [Maribellus maritimus]
MQARQQNTPDKLKEYTLKGNEEISPGVHLISFDRDVDFTPGQVVKIGIEIKTPPRIYSICSGNHENEIKILFNIKDDGFLTPKLAAYIPGDKILVSKPYGSFLGSKAPAWCIATGTGVAPFYSMFQSGLFENKKLIHGVSYLNQFYFEDELDWALGKNYVRCCSRESSCDVYPGRVTAYLAEQSHFPNQKYYICGKAIMVVEIRDLLIEKGVPFENIVAEIYF